jgi:hypothetical protein
MPENQPSYNRAATLGEIGNQCIRCSEQMQTRLTRKEKQAFVTGPADRGMLKNEIWENNFYFPSDDKCCDGVKCSAEVFCSLQIFPLHS